MIFADCVCVPQWFLNSALQSWDLPTAIISSDESLVLVSVNNFHNTHLKQKQEAKQEEEEEEEEEEE